MYKQYSISQRIKKYINQNASFYKKYGVFNCKEGKWIVMIKDTYRCITLSCHDTKEDTDIAYEKYKENNCNINK